ncbi:uncharacterized protein LACBIDRAFT_302478 [Laccaria bicolor S238N-H82]|uniref:DNA 3'-5' helicase n=1 Tax=Laccaria bicolor (strain S238N-H82 / ATCC MYA-4686) TaxID=486041 RepID=B0DHQ8_LACBS|nr:uncharacterized protein LACBIDRAFT_302478 [Laccaria bicolor S238N-H82]EDR05878.1 predicted protein [Laccaria bicolor S238N-H82]|eukprot:XP_001883554.1 predicted protein [Laccaria bicolor S238N-H82]
MYEDIVNRKFRQVVVSPEIAISTSFQKGVTSKEGFYTRLRALCIDEAHCMTLWGGTFRPDYGNLGILRGCFPKNVPIVVASATLPDHILDDIRRKLRLSQSVKVISVSNARPNVALSVRAMQHSDESKADLQFLIPKDASKPEDIPVTLVYCNQRTVAEDAADRLRDWAEDCGIAPDCIALYHSKVGQKRKRELEEKLQNGEIRILFCTDAVGMGCDMRNISHTILWGLPPSFCALVQQAGRAARDFSKLGEAILIVPSSVVKNGTTDEEVLACLKEMAELLRPEAENHGSDVEEVLASEDITALPAEVVNEEGIRVQAVGGEEDFEPEEEDTVAAKSRKKKFSKDTNTYEARFLSMFVSTDKCRRHVWDAFFKNDKKLQLIYPTTSSFQTLPNTRCCDNCTPRLFPVEKIAVTKTPGLKRGKKKQIPEKQEKAIRNQLNEWREEELVELVYPGIVSISGATVLGDDVVEKIATCGERIDTYSELRRHVRWAYGHDPVADGPNEYGKLLLTRLSRIYQGFDEALAEEQRQQALATPFQVITPESFYAHYPGGSEEESGGPSNVAASQTIRGNTRGRGTRARGRAN